MTEQQYRVIADRDKGDDPSKANIRVGDRYTLQDTGTDDDPLVRIERPVPTTDEQGFMCKHPMGFTSIRDGVLTCFDCHAECPGRCVCGAPYLSMQCSNRAHLRGPHLAPEPAPHPPTREQIAEASAEALCDVAYTCGRVWEAWQVGTMSEDDFAPAWEDDELTGSIADAVLALIQNGADR